MPLWLFQILCIPVIGLTLWLAARRLATHEQKAALVREYIALTIAGYLGEQTCISLYHHYAYSMEWSARIGDVPLLVPLIWPLVILAAIEVVDALYPLAAEADTKTLHWGRAALVAFVVLVDASLVEVVATAAGLWSWAEPGHLDVPLIGLFGWSFFAFGAALLLPWLRRSGSRFREAFLILAPVIAHALIFLSWWAAFRWGWRTALEPASLVFCGAVSIFLCGIAVSRRSKGHLLGLDIVVGRLAATALFLALMLTTTPERVDLWVHLACVGIPYSLATRWRAQSESSSESVRSA